MQCFEYRMLRQQFAAVCAEVSKIAFEAAIGVRLRKESIVQCAEQRELRRGSFPPIDQICRLKFGKRFIQLRVSKHACHSLGAKNQPWRGMQRIEKQPR